MCPLGRLNPRYKSPFLGKKVKEINSEMRNWEPFNVLKIAQSLAVIRTTLEYGYSCSFTEKTPLKPRFHPENIDAKKPRRFFKNRLGVTSNPLGY